MHIINKTRRQLKAENWETYQSDVENRRSMLEGDYVSLFEAWLQTKISKVTWDAFGDKYIKTRTQWLQQDVLNQTVKVYTSPSKRYFQAEMLDNQDDNDDTEALEEDDTYAQILKTGLSFDYDQKMGSALRYAETLGACLIRPWILDSDPEKIRVQIITPDQFWVDADPLDSTKLTGVSYYIPFTDSQGNTVSRYYVFDTGDGSYMEQQTHGQITEPGFVVFNDSEMIGDNDDSDSQSNAGETINFEQSMIGDDYPYRDENNNMILTFSVVSVETPEGALFNRERGTDLYDGTFEVMWIHTQRQWLLQQQSHKQIVITGEQGGQLGDRALDPAMPLIMQADVDDVSIKVIDLSSSTDGYEKARNDIYESVLTRRNVSIETFTRTAQRQTAEAQRIQNEGIQAYQRILQTDMRLVESTFAQNIRTVWNHKHANRGPLIDENAVFNIDFGETFDPDPYANHAEDNELQGMNVISIVDRVLEHNKDIPSRDEALEVIKRNRDENALAKRISPGVQAVIDAVPPPNEDTDSDELDTQPELEPSIERQLDQAPTTTESN